MTSLVSLQQENVKKSEKLKNQFILKNNIVISSYLLNEWRNFNQTFGKDMTYDYIKSHKKSRLQHFSEIHIFGKTARGPNWAPVFLRLSYYLLLFENLSKYTNKLFDKSPLWQLLLFSVGEHAKQDNYNFSSVRNNQVFLITGVIKLQLENSVKRNKQRFWDKQGRYFLSMLTVLSGILWKEKK